MVQNEGDAGDGVEIYGPAGEFFRGVVEGTSEAVVTLDADGTVVYANRAVEDVLGYAPAELEGRRWDEFVAPASRERHGEAIRAYLADADSGERPAFDLTARHADGRDVRLSVSFHDHECDADRLVTGVVRERRDRPPSDDLPEERRLLAELFETSPVPLVVADDEGEILRANDRAAGLLGLSPGKMADSGDETGYQVYDADGDPLPESAFPKMRALETGEPVYGEELQVEGPDGRRRWYAVNAAPVTDADGEVDRVVVAGEDITEIKERKRELEHRRAELRSELEEVFERVTDAFFGLNADWEFTYVNDRAAEVLGRDAEALEGRNIWEAFPEAAGSTFQDEYERAMESQESVSFEEYYPPLETWFAVRAHPSETGLSVYFRDVTRRKARVNELERDRRIIETIDDGVYVLDEGERFVLVNDAFCELVGYDREELLGEHASLVHSEEINATASELSAEITAGERDVASLEFELETADGDTVPVESRFGPYPDGEAVGRLGVVRDVTERREREAELRQQNERLDAFASMLAHELRNPLGIAQMYLEMGVEGDEAAFDEVGDALERMEEMIDSLLVVSRGGAAVEDAVPVSLADAASDAWTDVDAEEASLSVDSDGRVVAAPGRLRQVLENLFRNGVEHAGSDVTLRVGDLADGFYVEDDGPGIPPRRRDSVFDPGASTSSVGLGLGLAVVQYLAEAHGWEVALTDGRDGGARFEFTGIERRDVA